MDSLWRISRLPNQVGRTQPRDVGSPNVSTWVFGCYLNFMQRLLRMGESHGQAESLVAELRSKVRGAIAARVELIAPGLPPA